MSDTIIKLENISKQYRLGTAGTGWLSLSKSTLRGDCLRRGLRRFQRWWHRMRGKDDPTLKIGYSEQKTSLDATKDVIKDVTKDNRIIKILEVIQNNPDISTQQLSVIAKVSLRTVMRDLELLKQKGILKRTGGRKEGKWEITNYQ